MHCQYPGCEGILDEGARYCPMCGQEVSAQPEPQLQLRHGRSGETRVSKKHNHDIVASQTMPAHRYRSLRTIAKILKGVAIIIFVLNVVVTLVVVGMLLAGGGGEFAQMGRSWGISDSDVALVLGCVLVVAIVMFPASLVCLWIYGTAEMIELFIHLERNTLATARILKSIAAAPTVEV